MKKKSSPLLPSPLLPQAHRKKSMSASSSSFSSSNSSTSSSLPSPSLSLTPSPYHQPSKPSSVPFSWERKPGIPFTPLNPHYSTSRPLPLPPSKLNQKGRNKDNLTTNIRRRRKALEIVFALIQRLSTFDPYGSCKSAVKADVANEGSKKMFAAKRQMR